MGIPSRDVHLSYSNRNSLRRQCELPVAEICRRKRADGVCNNYAAASTRRAAGARSNVNNCGHICDTDGTSNANVTTTLRCGSSHSGGAAIGVVRIRCCKSLLPA